jgi:hypothetical protein
MPSVTNILARTVGAGALLLTGYEVVKMSSAESSQQTMINDNNDLVDVYVGDKTSGYSGSVLEKGKQLYKGLYMDSNFMGSTGIFEFLGAFANNIISSAVPIALGLGALLTGNKITLPQPGFIKDNLKKLVINPAAPGNPGLLKKALNSVIIKPVSKLFSLIPGSKTIGSIGKTIGRGIDALIQKVGRPALEYILKALGKYPGIGKACALLLALYGAMAVSTDVIGMGKKNKI